MVEGALVPRESYCVVIGGINVDLQGFSRATYVAGDSNPGYVRRATGGVGRNIAENLVRLGLRTELITVLGEEEEWSDLIQSTIGVGIGLGQSPRLHDVNLPTYLCILEPDGHLVGAVADMGAIDRLSIEHLEARRELLDGASAIVVDGNVPQECVAWVAESYGARRSGARATPAHGGVYDAAGFEPFNGARPLLIADPVSGAKARKFISCFGKFDIAKPNIAEAAVIAGLPHGSSPDAIVASLAAQSNLPSELFISRGERGIAFARGDSIEEIALCSAELRPPSINRSGSGDAACAALVWLSIARRQSGSPAISARRKAQFAIAAALFAAAAEEPVNPQLTIEKLCETARTCYPELASLAGVISNGGLS